MDKILYIDCFSGISGDMMVGAFLDMQYKGIDLEFFQNALYGLEVKGYSINACKKMRGSIMATKFNVIVEEQQPPRNFEAIKCLVSGARLEDEVKKTVIKMFSIIAEAEAKIHGTKLQKVHFHEVGAVDSIVDIVCVALAINKLSPRAIYSRSIPLGSGKVNTMHGVIPVPAPATVEILTGLPVYGGGFDYEVTTPTGAAIIKTLADYFEDIPEMTIESVGNGAGAAMNTNHLEHREQHEQQGHRGQQGQNKHQNHLEHRENLKHPANSGKKEEQTLPPDILRLIVGTTTAKKSEDKVLLISTNIDDAAPEIIGHVQEMLLFYGALDCWTEPVFMKKNRLASKLCVLCKNENIDDVMKLIFTGTSSLGIRVQEISRYCLDRAIKKVKLPYGEADVKIGYFRGKQVTVSPEYESCRILAECTGKPLKEVYRDLILFFSSK